MLPEKYKWIESIGTLPKLLSAMLQYLGVKEIKGSANNPVIMNMAKTLGIDDIYTSDDKQPWCALLMNFLIFITGKPRMNLKKDKYNLLRALYLMNYGEAVAPGDERLGDIGVLKREGGGHTFILIAKANSLDGNPIGIGGNQGDKIGFDEFDKDRIEGYRRFYATGIPESCKQYVMSTDGTLSTNEA